MFLILLAAAVVATSSLPAANVPATVQVAPEIAQKIARGSILSVVEIATLSRSGFPEDQLRAHLRSSRAVYRLGTCDIAALQEAGVSNALIDEMLARTYAPATVRRYAYPGPRFYRAPVPSLGGSRFGFHGARGGFHGGGHGRH
jgi:hypothetical protein